MSCLSNNQNTDYNHNNNLPSKGRTIGKTMGSGGGGVSYRCSISMQKFFLRNLFVAGFVLLGNSLEGQGRFFLVYSLRINFSPQFYLSRSPLTQTKRNHVIFSSPTVNLLTAHCDIFSFKRRNVSAISQQCFIGLIPFIQ